jgi:hypothetical protein
MRFFIRMSSSAQASAVVSSRHHLKGSPVAIFDHLSPAEVVAHRQLWSTFVEARAKGLKAQFSRARLFVDGVVVPPPSS